jgi:hypothetical protein
MRTHPKTYEQLTDVDWALIRAMRLVSRTKAIGSDEFAQLAKFIVETYGVTFERMCAELHSRWDEASHD